MESASRNISIWFCTMVSISGTRYFMENCTDSILLWLFFEKLFPQVPSLVFRNTILHRPTNGAKRGKNFKRYSSKKDTLISIRLTTLNSCVLYLKCIPYHIESTTVINRLCNSVANLRFFAVSKIMESNYRPDVEVVFKPYGYFRCPGVLYFK